jgi:hypothetical protein
MVPEPRRFDDLSPESYERALRRSAEVAEASPATVAPEDGDLVDKILKSTPGDIAKEVAAASDDDGTLTATIQAASEGTPTHDGRHRAADR